MHEIFLGKLYTSVLNTLYGRLIQARTPDIANEPRFKCRTPRANSPTTSSRQERSSAQFAIHKMVSQRRTGLAVLLPTSGWVTHHSGQTPHGYETDIKIHKHIVEAYDIKEHDEVTTTIMCVKRTRKCPTQPTPIGTVWAINGRVVAESDVDVTGGEVKSSKHHTAQRQKHDNMMRCEHKSFVIVW